MTATITNAFDLPRAEDITALGFVIRLEDGSEEKKRQLVADYVLTPAVRAALPTVLGKMADVQARGEDHGRFVHGSFGSGKSHFMGFVGLLLEDDPVAWAKDDPDVRALETRHRGWIREARLLVVRTHMMTVNRHGWGFDRAMYEAFNHALARHRKAPFEFLHVDGILDEARAEARAYGDAFWRQLEQRGVVGSQDDFEAMASGKPQHRESLARAYLAFKGRDPATAGIDPNWAEGLQRMARHARSQGFGGLVFLVDELLLWLSEKAGPEFKQAINQLNVIVDHTDGQRAVPVYVFVARQRKTSEFFPDMVSEDQLHEHLAHHSKRFEETRLEDVELRHICKERVLKRKPAGVAAVAKVLGELEERHKKLLPMVLQNGDPEYLRDVYPFHPALIEMLIDISSLMQRERTALRLLYELLVLHYPMLPLGELLPVGSAFEAIFPASGVEGSKRKEDLSAIHRLYYERFRPAIRALRDQWTSEGSGRLEQRAQVLDQLVKTALLAEVSPRLRGAGGLTVEKLVRLNEADVEGETDRGKMATAYQDLVGLSQRVPSLQLTGTGKTAVVRVVLQGANFGEILERARSKVGHPNARFKPFYEVLTELLGLTGKKGFGEGEAKEGLVRVAWRGTRREVFVAIRNVREARYEEFKPQPGEDLRLLIDYPWDDPGHSVEEDRDRAFQVRKSEGSLPTQCWLPRHLTPFELQTLGDYVACQYIRGDGQDELLGNLGPHDRQQVIEQAVAMATTMREKLVQDLKNAFKNHGECVSLWPDVAGSIPEMDLAKNIEVLAARLLDKRFPAHPDFKTEPRANELELVAQWMAEAFAVTDRRAPFDDATGRALKALAEPLELVSIGQTHATLRLDTRYIKDVMQATSSEKARWGPIDERLTGLGMQPLVRSLFLVFLVRAAGIRARHPLTGEPVDVQISGKPAGDLVLERAVVFDVAQWSRLRELGEDLFAVKVSDHRSLGEQDRVATELKKAASHKRDGSGVARREGLGAVHEDIVRLAGVDAPRLDAIKDARTRIAPLVSGELDSFKRLHEFIGKWPADSWRNLAARTALREIAAWAEAIGKLDENLRSHLLQAIEHPTHGAAITAHLDALRGLIGGNQAEHPLSTQAIADWNTQGNDLLRKLIVVAPPPPPPPPPPPAPTPVPPPSGEVTVRASRIDVHDGDALNGFWRDLRDKLQNLEADAADIDVIIRPRP